jgi:glycosyltransferase involved in cell wall biosynthesis
MKILFVADGRSPTTISWLKYWIESDHEIHLLSSYPCEKILGLSSLHIFPIAFSQIAGKRENRGNEKHHNPRPAGKFRNLLQFIRYYIGPPSLFVFRRKFEKLIYQLQPDMVHALRIPFEGMLAVNTPEKIPLAISIWGNDITLHAHGSFLMSLLTRKTLTRGNALLADTNRDIALGKQWGFDTGKPTLVVPGSGGISINGVQPAVSGSGHVEEIPDGPIIVNPRGQRPGSIRQDVFFRSIPRVLEKIPTSVFICPSMKDDRESEKLVSSMGIQKNVKLWPILGQEQLWSLFRKADIYVSPSLHDGTPNSLLEAMACGCYPVVGNIESMREWIQQGINGTLVDSTSENSISEAIIQAINQPAMRSKAAKINATMISDRADYRKNMKKVENFYKTIVLIK